MVWIVNLFVLNRANQSFLPEEDTVTSSVACLVELFIWSASRAAMNNPRWKRHQKIGPAFRETKPERTKQLPKKMSENLKTRKQETTWRKRFSLTWWTGAITEWEIAGENKRRECYTQVNVWEISKLNSKYPKKVGSEVKRWDRELGGRIFSEPKSQKLWWSVLVIRRFYKGFLITNIRGFRKVWTLPRS